ncbi:YndM family protein [Heyndrickxia sp. NPDC080065]|uniref:YndM family protein n=1 Tax=Heyndrickxia sp. NPDC080065 TaxID=3390568 RepID=UPI003D00EB72
MKHIKAMTIKFVANLIVLFIILGMLFGFSFTNIVFISLVLSVISYLVGDIWVLPKTNNTVATISDFALSFIVIWFLTAALTYANLTSLFISSVVSAGGVSIVEFFFHKYISTYTFKHESEDFLPGYRNFPSYQTEASEDIAPEIEKNKENKV